MLNHSFRPLILMNPFFFTANQPNPPMPYTDSWIVRMNISTCYLYMPRFETSVSWVKRHHFFNPS